MDAPQLPPLADRRGFCKKALATILGVVAGLIPAAAGLTVFFDPLRRKAIATGAIRVASLDGLPSDGIPRKFPVIASRTDAWNKFTAPIGAVYLRRTGEKTLAAFNVVCPHAGCFVDFVPERGLFHCPCHDSTFKVNGQIDNPDSPAQRGLDDLKVEIRNNT